MQLHELQPTKKRPVAKRIGRGGKRGKTSGKGHKGQKARAGNSSRPETRDLIKRLPKLRGHGTNRAKTVNSERVLPVILNLSALEQFSGTDVTPKTLVVAGLVATRRKRVPAVKLLGQGELKKALTVRDCFVSATAKQKIEAAGGTVA